MYQNKKWLIFIIWLINVKYKIFLKWIGYWKLGSVIRLTKLFGDNVIFILI